MAGSGTYTYAGVKHAEILALEQAGAKARGGTLYINLEPHAHQGRTAPCTDALIQGRNSCALWLPWPIRIQKSADADSKQLRGRECTWRSDARKSRRDS